MMFHLNFKIRFLHISSSCNKALGSNTILSTNFEEIGFEIGYLMKIKVPDNVLSLNLDFTLRESVCGDLR